MRTPRCSRPTGPKLSDDAAKAAGGADEAGDADEAAARTGCPLLPEALQAETVPVTALVTLPAWRALAARLRREQDAADRAIADAIDAATEVV